MNIILSMIAALVIAVSPTKGVAPAEIDVTFHITGDYTGRACVAIFEPATKSEHPVAVLCAEDLIESNPHHSVDVVHQVTGYTPGEFVFVGVLPDTPGEDEAIFSNQVEVSVTEE